MVTGMARTPSNDLLNVLVSSTTRKEVVLLRGLRSQTFYFDACSACLTPKKADVAPARPVTPLDTVIHSRVLSAQTWSQMVMRIWMR